MATVYVPTPLRRLTGGQAKIVESAATVGELFQKLDSQYPGFSSKLLNGDGGVKRFINVFRNDDEIRTLDGLETTIDENDKVSIVPAMAGGGGDRGLAIRDWVVRHSKSPISNLQSPFQAGENEK